MTLVEILKNRKCFKLVCGAGNEDAREVEKLIAVYAKAGANYFDLSAKSDVVYAAKLGLERVVSKNKLRNYFFNVSVGMPGDPHVRKALIVAMKCKACSLCMEKCPQRAIVCKKGAYSVIKDRCIGCGICAKVCPMAAVKFITEAKDLKLVLPPLVKLGLSSLELHAVTGDEETAYSQWSAMTDIFPGVLSLCLDRSHLGDDKLVARIRRFCARRKNYTTIIQADGAPMSGGDDRYNTTLQALATADIVNKAKLPVWLLISGGTNSKTTRMAGIFEIGAHGVAIGSYARKIIGKYLEREDLLDNRTEFDRACRVAKRLVDKSLKYL
jgi:Fe-S-cluster-containing hydrogenase component 2